MPWGVLCKEETQVSRPQKVTSLPWRERPTELGTWVTRHPLLEKPLTQLTGLERRKGLILRHNIPKAMASGKVTVRMLSDTADPGTDLIPDTFGHLTRGTEM